MSETTYLGMKMSRERELLERCRVAINIRYDRVMLIRLHHDIENLLGEVEELLSQPEQEPVAWYWEEQFGVIAGDWGLVSSIHKPKESKYRKNIHPLYTSPQKVEQEPLSDEEIDLSTTGMSEFGSDMFKAGIRAAERTHGIGVDDE